MIEAIFPNVDWARAAEKTVETLFMTGISLFFVFIIGILLGLLLFLTSPGNIWGNKTIHFFITAVVNVFRSIPFVILIILLLPFTKFLVGSITGKEAAIPALVIGTAPFYARLVEIGLREIDKGVIEAAKAMGATTVTLIRKVLIPESLPAIVSGITVTAIALIGYTAIAGVIGAGGLGDYAYLDGFSRNNNDVTLFATITILLIVFAIQLIGDWITKKLDKR
jgi:Binding-protein-dependent transport system inner membrane component.